MTKARWPAAGRRSVAAAILAALALTGSAARAQGGGGVRAGATRDPVTGVYVLTQAEGRPLPFPFSLDLGGADFGGELVGARLVLNDSGGYRADIVVRQQGESLIPLPGRRMANGDRVVTSTGRYAAAGDSVTLDPSDFLTQRLASRLYGISHGAELALTAADTPTNGSRVPLRAALRRIRAATQPAR